MDFSKYINKWVKVDLTNGHFYEGIVLTDTTNTTLELKDRNGQMVTLSFQVVLYIREVKRGNGNGRY